MPSPATPSAHAAVHIENLTKVFYQSFGRSGIRAVDGLSLSVVPGEIFGLLGPNGAGKTTLVKVLLGIVRPTAGRAHLFGLPTDRPEARARIGFLPENHRFPDFLTAEQMLDLYGRLAGIPADVRRKRIPELLERVSMSRWRTTRIRKYSKGMMQRIGLAQALLGAPDLIFLDEPTDGVDPIGRREIRDLLLWLRDQGTTVFLNSHLLSEIEQVCTRVAILHEGRLVREGRVDEMTAVQRHYTLTATEIPADDLATLGEALTPLPTEAQDTALRRYRIHAEERAQLNAVLDRLRTAGVEIEAVQPVRRTLEDYFIDVIDQA